MANYLKELGSLIDYVNICAQIDTEIVLKDNSTDKLIEYVIYGNNVPLFKYSWDIGVNDDINQIRELASRSLIRLVFSYGISSAIKKEAELNENP